MDDIREKTINSKKIYNGKILNLRIDEVQLPNGRKSSREVVEHPGGVAIIPVTATGEIILVKQFRKPIEQYLLELPAGKLDPGEDPARCAVRELQEETGYRAEEIEYLYSFYTTPGFSDEIIHFYLANKMEYIDIDPDPDEIIEVIKFKPSTLMEMVKTGEIKDGKTIMGLLGYLGRDSNVE